jgi:hypothetical protein
MDRRQMMAAEIFGYSYAHYADHLGIGHARYEDLMPEDVDLLERDGREGWEDARLARALEIEEDKVALWRRLYQEAKAIIDAPSPAESFRRGVRYSIQHAVERGLTDDQAIEKLVVQIGFRAADLGYLLDLGRERLSRYSEELRDESALHGWNQQSIAGNDDYEAPG